MGQWRSRGWVPAGAAQGRRQQLREQPLQQDPSCCFPKDQAGENVPAAQRAPPHLQLRSWGQRPSAPLILPCPSCKERFWEHGRLCGHEATAWRIPLAGSLLQREGLGQRGLPELGPGPGECPDKVSWPRDCGCGSAANHFKPFQWGFADTKAGPWDCTPGMKEIAFCIFHIKKISHVQEKGKEERVWDFPCPWTTIILLAGGSSFLSAFPLPPWEEREVSVQHKSRKSCGIYKAGI